MPCLLEEDSLVEFQTGTFVHHRKWAARGCERSHCVEANFLQPPLATHTATPKKQETIHRL